MKHFYHLFLAALLALPTGLWAQGWPANYGGVMLQGFSWDSFSDSQWTNLESQVNDFKGYFDLIWVPQSGKCQNPTSMGYDIYYYWNQNSSFGTEAQLRSMIKTFKDNGIGTIADVVVNHRNTTGWFTFPAETYNGVTYQMQSTDIVANDDGGATKTEADKEGVSLSSNNDEGEDWGGMRDLDHKSANVQTIIKAYENFLLNDLGYTGFRYDMVKGFNGSHVGEYNKAAGVQYSVGECWDSNQTIENWINATKIDDVPYSAAFDFQFKYNVRDAVDGNDWSKLNSTNNLMHDSNYNRYAVTFVENHDTQVRADGSSKGPLSKDTLAANAYMLAMPGTPCVFLPHWKAYKQEIKAMIDARKFAGITNQSTYSNYRSSTSYYGNTIKVNNVNRLLVYVGSGWTEPTSNRWVKILSGYHYAYYLAPSCETAWADKASGTYSDVFAVTLTAVSVTTGAQLVYTLDGSTPTASNGTKVSSGTSINITSDCTLKVGLLKNGSVSGVVTRTYTVKPFVAHTATVYFKNPSWSTPVYFYAWDSNGTLNGSWPGKIITATTTINGDTWYYQTFNINTADYSFNIIFDQGSGKDQTVDIGPITTDKYYELSDKNNGKFTVTDLTSSITGINNIVIDKPLNADNGWYTLSGIRMNAKPAQKGIYIHQGKKIVVK